MKLHMGLLLVLSLAGLSLWGSGPEPDIQTGWGGDEKVRLVVEEQDDPTGSAVTTIPAGEELQLAAIADGLDDGEDVVLWITDNGTDVGGSMLQGTNNILEKEHHAPAIGEHTFIAWATFSHDQRNDREDQSEPQNVMVVGIQKIIVDGSNPENEGPAYTIPGTAVTLRAKPSPNGAAFPSGNPDWSITTKPIGSTIADPADGSATASINPDKVGKYVIKAACGTSNDTFEVYALKVEYKEDTTQAYGFDDHTNATTPWKSVEETKTDKAKAEITPAAGAAGVYFKSSDTAKMTVAPAKATASPQAVTVTGVAKGTADSDAKIGSDTGPNAATMKVFVKGKITRSVAVRLVHEENDDVQVIPVGQGKPNVTCITSGADGVLDTAAGGDDVVDAANKLVHTGPNGVCNTTALGDDTQVIANGNGAANEIGITKGANAFRDSAPAGDDAIAGDDINTGPDGICNTTAKSGNLNSTDVADADITAYLNNKVYNQAVCEWTIHRLPAKAVNFDLNRDGKIDTSVWMTAEMQAVRDACKDDARHANIFLVDNGSFPGGTGYMSSNQRYGYVHADASTNDTQTIAHELGHGTFGLAHTAGDGDNLMYPSVGDKWRLRKDQWNTINPP